MSVGSSLFIRNRKRSHNGLLLCLLIQLKKGP